MKKRLEKRWKPLLIKEKRNNYLIYWQIAGLLLATIAVTAVAAGSEQLEALETRIQAIQTRIHNTRTEYGQLQRQLQYKEENIGKVAERLEQLHSELNDKRNTLSALEKQQQQKTVLFNQQRQILARQIRAAYIMAQQNYFKLLLNQEKPAVVGRLSVYYTYFNRALLQRIKTISTTLQHLQRLKQRIHQETELLDRLVSHRTDKEEQFALSRSERQKILAQLAHSLESQDKELKRLQEDKRQLQKLLGTLEEALRDVPQESPTAFSELKGQLPFPLRGKLLKKFGEPLISGLQWQGILIDAPLGTKVQAVASGRIAFAEWFQHFGLLVIVDHGNSYMSLYAHNQSLYVKTGDWVPAGTVIASLGNSGGRHLPALYFEIRQQGIPVNPLKWLRNSS